MSTLGAQDYRNFVDLFFTFLQRDGRKAGRLILERAREQVRRKKILTHSQEEMEERKRLRKRGQEVEEEPEKKKERTNKRKKRERKK